jgi:hypothetical protein
MKAVAIGKGLYRITIRSKAKLERISKIPGVIVDNSRVIFPANLYSGIKMILEPPSKRKPKEHTQTKLF